MTIRWGIPLLCTAVLCLLLQGCNDRVNLEDVSLPLALGLDLNEKEKFQFSISAPIFSKDIKKKSREVSGTAKSLRESRSKQDSQLPGSVQGRNYQVILLGKRLLQHNGWFPMLDVIYRDTRNTLSDRIVMVDGPVSSVMNLNAPDQPPVAVFLRDLVDSSSDRGESVKTTAIDLHRQFYDQGMTPFISEIKLERDKITMKGTALLTHGGKYAASLGFQETVLLLILRGEDTQGMSLSYAIPGEPGTGPFARDRLSFTLGKTNAKINTSYQDGRFHFQIRMKSKISISEELLPHTIWSNEQDLLRKIEEKVEEDFKNILRKFQESRVDPVGFGIYARAYEYPHFKPVRDNWAEELSRAKFDVDVQLKIESIGPVQ
jgi:Ger(x)C family germination protein